MTRLIHRHKWMLLAQVLRAKAAGVGLIMFTTACGQDPSFKDVSTKSSASAPNQGGAGAEPAQSDDVKVNPKGGAAVESPAPGRETPVVDSGSKADSPASPSSNGEKKPKDTAKDEGQNNSDNNDNDADDPDASFVSKIRTDRSQTVTVDTFYLPDIYPAMQTVENAAEPMKKQEFRQSLGDPRFVMKTVIDREPKTKSFSKKPPIRYTESHVTAYKGKPIDLFVTVDDSESFTAASIARARNAVRQLIEDLYEANWVLYIGGLEGVGGRYDRFVITKSGKTLAQAKTAADSALDSIFSEGSLGDERVFRSLNLLAYDYRGQDRDLATHLYMVITDAPNCKDRNNEESSTCSRTPDHTDHHTYLRAKNSNLPQYMRHMNLFGAYYRMTDNASVCGNADSVEAPLSSESLKMDSQYADAAFQFEKLIYPETAAGATPSWIGNLCSASEDLSWLSRLTDAAKEMLAYRFAIKSQPDVFAASDSQYNLKVLNDSGTALTTAEVRVEGSRVIVLANHLNGTYQALYHTKNDYDRLSYLGLLNPKPEAETVSLVWTGGSTDCKSAASWTGLSADIKCRHNGQDLILRDLSFLPSVLPGDAAVPVTVNYYNEVEKISQIIIAANSAIYGDTLKFSTYPAAASDLIAGMTQTSANNGKSLAINFPGSLPPGTYRIEYYEYDQTKSSFAFNDRVAPGADSLLCFVPSMASGYGLDADSNLYIEPMSAAYPCTYSEADKKLYFEGRVPVDPVTGKAELSAAYKGYVEPLSVFSLDYPPHANEVKVVVQALVGGTPQTLATNQYTVAANQVVLAQALQPGEKLTLTYDFWPPLKRCYPLSAKAFSGQEYFVWYGPMNQEAALSASQYELTLGEGQTKPMICLSQSLVNFSRRLVVGYVSDVKETEEHSVE